ncbi:threonine ammonia-lyase [Kineosporia succinea]|uniref:Threonine dehydratase n=1 Tax=Kineosporia succinea TaxID=84632 RepID=A0ABT9PGV4_9ACTN|nr:pyridoxal-phosphate dependent enzyme [Kineosporia succinea]MDP9831170.1 threonine dehydratase [Kineosporia succinea]
MPDHSFPQASAIEQAARQIDPVFTGTPLTSTASLDRTLGCRMLVKVETLGPLRCFKGRGTDWFVRGLDAEPGTELVTVSAGNFGQGVARAAASRGLRATVFAARAANPAKVEAMRALGAQVHLVGRDFDEAKEAALDHARAGGLRMVVDGDERAIAEGAGTIALEIERAVPQTVNAMVVPVGNGALAGGVGTWFRHASPGTEVVGVAAAGAPATARSWREGRLVETSSVDTIADGLAGRTAVAYAVDVMREVVHDLVEVDDELLVRAVRLVHEHLGLVAEPSGAAGLAAVLADPARYAGRTVATVLCGSNIDPARAREFLFG